MEMMNEMFEIVTDEEVLKKLEHIFDDKAYVNVDRGFQRKGKRTNAEVKSMLYRALESVVKKTFRKRTFIDEFNEAELEKVSIIDEFLKNIVKHKEHELFPETRKQYFFLCFKSTYIRRDGSKIECFYNKELCVDELEYKRIQKYVAKAVYRLCTNRHIEVYFAVNTFKALLDSGYFKVERKKENVLSSACVFVDIDLPKDIQELNLNDEELLEFVKRQYEEMYLNLPWTYCVKTGSGIHIYYALDTSVYLEREESKDEYKELLRKLQYIYKDIGSDFNCSDITRILRMPCSFNRKQKFGKEPREVRILEYNDVSYNVDEIKSKLSFLQSGGMEQLFQDLLDDLFYYEEIYELTEIEEVDYREDYVAAEEKEECKKVRPDVKVSEKKNVTNYDCSKKKDFEYKGIQPRYNLESETFYLCRDMKIWLSNRNRHDGARHTLLFYFNYCWYVFNGERTLEKLLERSISLNELFKPMLDRNEVKSIVKYNFNYLKARDQNFKSIRNVKVQNVLHFTEEEMEILQGVYAETEEEYLQKKKVRGNERDKASYYRKRQAKGKIPQSELKKQHMSIIIDEPLISYNDFFLKTGLSKSCYDNYRKELKLDREKRKELLKEYYLKPFKDNANISKEEYCKGLDCKQATYYKYRKIYNNL